MKWCLAVVVVLAGLFGLAEQHTGSLLPKGPEAWLELMRGKIGVWWLAMCELMTESVVSIKQKMTKTLI